MHSIQIYLWIGNAVDTTPVAQQGELEALGPGQNLLVGGDLFFCGVAKLVFVSSYKFQLFLNIVK